MRRFSWSVAMLLGWAVAAHAQGIPVYDNTNFLQNIITAAESTISAVENVTQTAQGILNLTAVGGIVVAGGILEDMILLGRIVNDAQGLSYDIASLEAQVNVLFDLGSAPDTREGLTARLAEIQRVRFQAYSYAARVQTLLRTALHTIDHLQHLLDDVGALVGNLQGSQVSTQAQMVIGKHMANLDVQTAAFQRAQTVDKLSEALIIESINRIQARRLEDWPQ